MPKRVDSRKQGTSRRRNLIIILVFLCGISILIGILCFDRLPSTIGDNAEFAILARSLVDGRGYRHINNPAERPGTKYPPGFPAMLALWIQVFPDSMFSMKILVLICYVLMVVITFLLARKLIGESLGIITAGLVASSWPVVAYSHQVLSDIPYTLFSLLALLLLVGGRRGSLTVVLGIAVCVWSYFIRTSGVSLVLAAAIFLFIKGRKKEVALLLCGFIVVAGLWAIRNYALTGEGSRYTKLLLSADPNDPERGLLTFLGLINRVWINLSSYVGRLMQLNLFPTLIALVSGSVMSSLRIVVSVMIMAVIVLGGYLLRRRSLLLILYVPVYMGIYLLWPEIWRTERFMVPITPLLAIYFFGGLKRILNYFTVGGYATLVVCLGLALTNFFSIAEYARRQRGYHPGWRNYLQAALWVGEHTEPDAVVLCRKPFLFYVLSDRRTISYPYTRDEDAMRRYLLKSRPDYIVIENFGGPSSTDEYLLPVLRKMVESLELAHRTEEPANIVLKFTPQETVGEQ